LRLLPLLKRAWHGLLLLLLCKGSCDSQLLLLQ
jgi:hypothetical protein